MSRLPAWDATRLALTALTFGGLVALTACPQSGSQSPGGDQPEGAAAPGDPAGNTESHPDDARWSEGVDQGVLIKGTISYDGEIGDGSLRIDILTQKDGQPPHLVSAETLSGLGVFTIDAPKDFGEVHLVGFIDRSGDGPSADDPAAAATVVVGSEDVTDLTLVLSDEPDLGALTPGAPPEGGPEAPPQPEDPNAERNGAEGPAPEGAVPEGAEKPPEGGPPPGAPPAGEPPPGGAPAEGAAPSPPAE